MKEKLIKIGFKILIFIVIGIVSYFLITFFSNNKYDFSTTKNIKEYKEIYYLLNNMQRDNINKGEMLVDTSGDFSATNVQVSGIDEADIVKTDGSYIYVINYENLYILDKDLNILTTYKHNVQTDDEFSNFSEIYVYNNYLVAIKHENEYTNYYMERSLEFSSNGDTSIVIFDISDKSDIKKLSESSQSGYYLSSRMIDNNIYLVSNYYVYDFSREESSYIPLFNNELIETDDIYVMPNPETSSYIVVSSIDVTTGEYNSKKSVFGSGNNIYLSLENLYVSSYGNITNDNKVKTITNLLKFSLNENIKLIASNYVDGYILNQFSMDEYNDYFRIVTTTSEYSMTYNKDDVVSSIDVEDINSSKNNIYVLDSNLNVVSKIEDLAKEERVYSVRFDKDVAYFVTFKQVDPLFVVDLSDVNNLKILSELKIPGFSEYLHIYNSNYLFGLGKEADLEGNTIGMKISMFNITDLYNVTEEYKYVLSDFKYSEASYNHKAILVSNEKNIIGFPAESSYLVFSFDNKFNKLAEISLSDEKYYSYNLRGIYIDNTFYVLSDTSIKMFNIENFELLDQIVLN